MLLFNTVLNSLSQRGIGAMNKENKTESLPGCHECGSVMLDVRSNRKFCSPKCKQVASYKRQRSNRVTHHTCRICDEVFPIFEGQGNKWLCSDECRRASNAKSVRDFHERRPLSQAIYRQKTRQKHGADSQNKRFYSLNPNAPRSCEACGESRVIEIAHKPGHERLGQRRSASNMVWPEQVWVLCPTCHRLHDRMGYSADELGLSL